MVEEDHADQTESDQVTGIDIVDGALVIRRFDDSETTYSFIDVLPTEDPETNGVLWNDEGVITVSYSVINELPTADPEVAGALWNDEGVIMVSSGP